MTEIVRLFTINFGNDEVSSFVVSLSCFSLADIKKLDVVIISNPVFTPSKMFLTLQVFSFPQATFILSFRYRFPTPFSN